MIRHLRAADRRRMPWKNGGGETVEIAVSPDGAGLDDFDWRVSMARVDGDGPFSSFPGIDRTLSILEDAGMRLEFDGREPVVFDQPFQPISFPADIPTTARLVAGPIVDLNVMSRRGRVLHGVSFLQIDGETSLNVDAATLLVLAVSGSLEFATDGLRGDLALHDCLLSEHGKTSVTLRAATPSTVAVIEFRHI